MPLARLMLLAIVTAAAAAVPGAGAAASPASAGAAATRSSADRPTTLLTLGDRRITEASGLAASVRHPGVLYTHNDSGDRPRVFAVGADGRTLAELTLAGASARDWEAIATGRDDAGRPALFVGDIGDNLHGVWPSVSVYRVTEPATLRDATVPATRYRFRYADGPRDAEALLVDPRTNRLYVASKEDDGAGLYQAPATLRTDRVNVLRRVAGVPPSITDGAFSPDGRTFVLRDYLDAFVYRAPGKRQATVRLPLQYQGESITYARDGTHLLAGSEGGDSDVWQVPLPDELRPATPSPEAGGDGSQASGPVDAASGRRPVGTLLVPLAAVAVVALLLTARRRRR
jgi:hypothetical protein